METLWDKKYAGSEYLYGEEPNQFFREFMNTLNPSTILLPGEGEGRNAVYAAQQGWTVKAFDTSGIAMQKAYRLARKANVSIDYFISDYQSYQVRQTYKLIGLLYTHMPSSLQQIFFPKVMDSLAEGGYVLMEVFDKKQLQNSSGGPKDIELLYSERELLRAFSELQVIKAETTQTVLSEGPGHQGEATVVRMILKK